jgi:hypothetical protein
MRRVIPAVLGLFFAANLCMAQNTTARLRRVTAILELQVDGMKAAYSSPVGSRVRVTNPANGRPAEVTIIEQIPEMERQIINLSPAAARELGMVDSGPVLVAPVPQPWQNSPAAEEATTKVAETQILTEVEINKQTDTDKEPIYVTINNYVITPQKPLQPIDEPNNLPQENSPGTTQPVSDNLKISQNNDKISDSQSKLDNREKDYYDNSESGLTASLPLKSEAMLSVFPQSKDDVQIVLGRPNRKTGEKYRLLVGTFTDAKEAFLASCLVQAAAFDMVQEKDGNSYKVFAVGIPTSMVLDASRRLGQIGFGKVEIQD